MAYTCNHGRAHTRTAACIKYPYGRAKKHVCVCASLREGEGGGRRGGTTNQQSCWGEGNPKDWEVRVPPAPARTLTFASTSPLSEKSTSFSSWSARLSWRISSCGWRYRRWGRKQGVVNVRVDRGNSSRNKVPALRKQASLLLGGGVANIPPPESM